MSHKTSAARRAAFFAALRETGNQTVAAERARVSRSWVQLQRSIDPAFKAEVAAAVAEAKASLIRGPGSGPGHAGSNKPPRGWAHLAGEELVVRGSRGRRVQVARARLKQWTPRVEERFLGLLAQCCNLRLALKAVGFSEASLHQHRKRWPAFDARCEEALGIGYMVIDRELIAEAHRLLDPAARAEAPPPKERPLARMTIDQAIGLVRLHERRAWEKARGIAPCGRARGRKAAG